MFDLERFTNTINTSTCYSLHICIEEIQGLNIFCSSLASYNFSNWSLSFVVPFHVLESKVLLSIVKGSIKVHHLVQISLSVMATKEAITNFIFQFNSIQFHMELLLGFCTYLVHHLFPCSLVVLDLLWFSSFSYEWSKIQIYWKLELLRPTYNLI